MKSWIMIMGLTAVLLSAGYVSAQEKMDAAGDIGTGIRTLHESLWRRARLDPDRTHVFLREDDGTERAITKT